MDDSSLVNLFWSRDESSITQTDAQYGAYCRTIAYNILDCHEDAGECVNDCYLRVWNAIPTDRPSLFAAYIAKIVRNIAFSRYRARTAAKRGGGTAALCLDELAECLADQSNIEREIDSAALENALGRFVHNLPQEKRVLFVLRYFYAADIKTISRKTHLGESKIKSSLLRTRNALKHFLEKEEFAL